MPNPEITCWLCPSSLLRRQPFVYPLHLCLMGNGGWEELVRKGLVLGVGSMPWGKLSLPHPFGVRGAPPHPYNHLFTPMHYSPVSTCSSSLGLHGAHARTSSSINSVIVNESHINRLKWMNNSSPVPAAVDGPPCKEIQNHLLHSEESCFKKLSHWKLSFCQQVR